jgi:ElaB/YqjD/DUF883 family membrane-anchored ribosome-binding protein
MEENFTGTGTGIGQTTGSNRTDWRPTDNGGLSQGDNALSTGGNTGGDNAKTPTGLTAVAHEYTDKISDAVSQAKDYLGEKASDVGGKIKEFATDDLSGLAEKAKDYTRQNPGQAILVAAAAGVLLGLFVRGRR